MQICMCPYVDTCSYISVGVGTTSKILPLTTPATMILWVVLENFHTKKYVCPISIGWTKSLAQGASVYIALRQQRRSTKHAWNYHPSESAIFDKIAHKSRCWIIYVDTHCLRRWYDFNHHHHQSTKHPVDRISISFCHYNVIPAMYWWDMTYKLYNVNNNSYIPKFGWLVWKYLTCCVNDLTCPRRDRRIVAWTDSSGLLAKN